MDLLPNRRLKRKLLWSSTLSINKLEHMECRSQTGYRKRISESKKSETKRATIFLKTLRTSSNERVGNMVMVALCSTPWSNRDILKGHLIMAIRISWCYLLVKHQIRFRKLKLKDQLKETIISKETRSEEVSSMGPWAKLMASREKRRRRLLSSHLRNRRRGRRIVYRHSSVPKQQPMAKRLPEPRTEQDLLVVLVQ